MKKIFTLIAVAAMAISANAETAILSWTGASTSHFEVGTEHPSGKTEDDLPNELTWSDGFKMAISSRCDKTYSSAKTIKIDGEDYTTIKLSNGADNTLTAPQGYVITNLTLYSYINKASTASPRTCYWKEVGGVTYTEDDATLLTDYNDLTDYQDTPDKVEFTINKLSSVKFTNTGEQLCFVAVVTYEAGTQSALAEIAAEENAPVEYYNLQGVRVANPENGLYIKRQGNKVEKVYVK